jgi:hypothetical protein
MSRIELGRYVSGMPGTESDGFLGELTHKERLTLRAYWPFWARREQLPPASAWRTWLIMAGRGFGKTRAGAEWVRHVAEEEPQARIALVARSIARHAASWSKGKAASWRAILVIVHHFLNRV